MVLWLGSKADKIRKIQLLQNSAARIVSRVSEYDHTPVLRALHWLPVAARLEFKILLLVFKTIYGLASDYITSLISSVLEPGRAGLRSESGVVRLNTRFLPAPKTKFYGGRAFGHVAPVLWNALPDTVRSAVTIQSFRSRLKTHLFKIHFNWSINSTS